VIWTKACEGRGSLGSYSDTRENSALQHDRNGPELMASFSAVLSRIEQRFSIICRENGIARIRFAGAATLTEGSLLF